MNARVRQYLFGFLFIGVGIYQAFIHDFKRIEKLTHLIPRAYVNLARQVAGRDGIRHLERLLQRPRNRHGHAVADEGRKEEDCR